MDAGMRVSAVSRRAVLGGLATSSAAVLLAACGAAQAPAAPAKEAPKEAPKEAAPKPAEQPKAAQQVTIVYLNQNPQRREIETQVFGGYSKVNPNVKLDIKPLESGQQARIQLPIFAAAGQPVGLVENSWGTWLHLAEVTPYFQRDKIEADKMFVPQGLDFYSYQGKTWGVPISMSVDAWAYNKDLFDAAGVSYPPNDPEDKSWTMEKFLEVAQKLTKGEEQFGMGTSYNGFNVAGVTDGTYFGGWAWDAKAEKATMNTEHFRKGMNFWIDIVDKYRAMPTSQQLQKLTGGATGNPFFLTGKIGMWGIFVVTQEAVQAKFKWGLAAIPYSGEGKNHSGRHFTHGLHIGNTNYKDATWEFVKWLLQTENAVNYLQITGHAVSPILPAQEAAKKWFEGKWNVDTTAYFKNALTTPQSGQGMLKYGKFYEVLFDHLHPIYANEVKARKRTVEEYLPYAEQYINANLLKK